MLSYVLGRSIVLPSTVFINQRSRLSKASCGARLPILGISSHIPPFLCSHEEQTRTVIHRLRRAQSQFRLCISDSLERLVVFHL